MALKSMEIGAEYFTEQGTRSARRRNFSRFAAPLPSSGTAAGMKRTGTSTARAARWTKTSAKRTPTE